MNTAGISAVIISKDEEAHIGACIKSLDGLVDEVIVVDSGSKDKTVSISESLGARVFTKDWEGYGVNKNYGADLAKFNWILSIDADEVVDEELKNAILNQQLKNSEIYLINNITNYCGHWIKYTEWRPAYKFRLYLKSNTRWDQRKVHEGLVHVENPRLVKLAGAMLHYSYTDYEEHLAKTDNYALLGAEQWIEDGKPPGVLKRIFGPTMRFIKSYLFNLGILEGAIGFRISKTNALHVRKKIQYYDVLKNNK